MARGVIFQILGQVGIYKKNLLFFLLLIPLVIAGYYYLSTTVLQANVPLDQTVQLRLGDDGVLRIGNNSVRAETFRQNETVRYRYQVINGLDEYLDQLVLAVALPRPVTEEEIAHRFINNGGALFAESELIDPQTIEFRAMDLDVNTQLAIEFEIPSALVTQNALSVVKTYFDNLPIGLWLGLSVGFPVLTLIILFLVAISKSRKVAPSKETFEELPAKLTPAFLGVLLRGKVTSREVAATLLDLARRGHLIIRQVNNVDFRFRRRQGTDKLHDFERMLLDQIFGPVGEKTDSEEISFYLAQEVFSKKISQSFMLIYQKISDFGYFYTNPLKLHRKYQVFGLLSVVIGVIGFMTTLLLGSGINYLLFFWAGMIFSSFFIISMSRSLPSRTYLGDKELSKWLAFRNYLKQDAPVSYLAFSQDRYLSYLPYAIVLDCEVEWTKKFHNFPFAQPSWFFSPGISSVEVFSNQLFPFLGHLAHVLSLNTQPANR